MCTGSVHDDEADAAHTTDLLRSVVSTRCAKCVTLPLRRSRLNIARRAAVPHLDTPHYHSVEKERRAAMGVEA